jgi:hypothetical protein
MAPVEVDAFHFSPDTREFLRLLHAHSVRYLIVGGEAVIYYGHSRLTGDVDLFFQRDEENIRRLFAALLEFWEGDIPRVSSADELLQPGVVVQFGAPPNRIDLLNAIDGVSFPEAWEDRETAILGLPAGEVPLPYIGLDGLIQNRRAAARPKDLEDLQYLRASRAARLR